MNRQNDVPQCPAGYEMVPVMTVYLEMRRNTVPNLPKAPAGCVIRRWRLPPLPAYRSLFTTVGGRWGWSGRLIMAEEELKALIHAGTTEVFRLRCDGQTAGFIELDRRDPGQTEIAYFGLLPEFIGRGLGKYLLDWTIHRAWHASPERVWLHTCAYDHPAALAVYRKAGFTAYDEKIEMQPYPEDFLQKLKPAGN